MYYSLNILDLIPQQINREFVPLSSFTNAKRFKDISKVKKIE
jgi:hypothetical protein